MPPCTRARICALFKAVIQASPSSERKVSIALCVVGAIVGEFVGADRGLGYLLLTATGALDGTLVWAALLVLIGLGIFLFQIIVSIERVAIRWHVSVRANDQMTFTP